MFRLYEAASLFGCEFYEILGCFLCFAGRQPFASVDMENEAVWQKTLQSEKSHAIQFVDASKVCPIYHRIRSGRTWAPCEYADFFEIRAKWLSGSQSI